MRFLQKHFVGFAVATLFTLALPVLRADEWDKRTVVTINQPIQVPHVVLIPGTYVFRLLDSPSNRDIVQIFDKNEQRLITTILALPNYRLTPTGKSVFTFWETPAGNPPAVRAWFYPGDNYGQEFVYPKTLLTQVAETNNTPPPAPVAAANPPQETAPVTTPQPSEEQPANTQEYAQAQPVQPAPAPEPAPQPVAPAPAAPAPSQLPQTASPVPLAGLVGLLSMAGFFTLRRVRSH